MSLLKVLGIAFLPADSISACDLLRAVKAKANSCKFLFDRSFFKYHSSAYFVH